ncbi:hypothetical protein RUM44_003172 [Polyplax serrata]|uniref:Uncharacterized protein n=1 Tax=Polyplax serrata TaxID=468196 RepID=A0ABR1AXS1_POLSC
MCDQNTKPNYQKLVDPIPKHRYDIFMGSGRWDFEGKRKKCPPPEMSLVQGEVKRCSCPKTAETSSRQCPTEPMVNLYVHLLPNGKED